MFSKKKQLFFYYTITSFAKVFPLYYSVSSLLMVTDYSEIDDLATLLNKVSNKQSHSLCVLHVN